MEPEGVERKLAAILSADVVAYSRLMAEDEAATVRTVSAYREQIGTLVREHRGRVVDSPGDNVLAEFPTATDAVECGVEIQRVVTARNAALPPDRKMEFRIGVHLGEVRVEEGRLYGDGVNVAARLEGLAEPSGISISAEVYRQVHNKLELGFEDLGEQKVKNIPDPVHVYRIAARSARTDPDRPAGIRWRKLRITLGSVAALIVLLGVGLWASWPRPLGLLIDFMGVSGPPVEPALPEKPSIVVLPFVNMSGDPDQEYFSDGITEDLTTDLAGNPFLFVIARNSAFAYKGKSVRVEDVGRELGVRYVLEGSVRRAEDRVRITAQLIDATTGFHIWSKRYDRDLADIFALQSEISLEILGAVDVEIDEAEFERIRRKPTEDLTAYDLFRKGLFHVNHFTREDNAHARRLFEEAIELDPDYADAHALLGGTYYVEYGFGWNVDPKLLDHADERLQRALTLNPSTPSAYVGLAVVHFWRGEPAAAVAAADRAIELGPSFAIPHFIRGASLADQGKFVGAMQSINRAMRLNPRAPPGQSLAVPYVNLLAGRTQEAVEMFEQARVANPDLILARTGLAAIYESEGRHEEASVMVQEILRVNPDFTAEHAAQLSTGWTTPERIKALRKAGLP